MAALRVTGSGISGVSCLVANSAAIDAATVLPGVTDGYTGNAPDLGALEFGRPLPVYGPRALADQP